MTEQQQHALLRIQAELGMLKVLIETVGININGRASDAVLCCALVADGIADRMDAIIYPGSEGAAA
jgi:hypothetical protein